MTVFTNAIVSIIALVLVLVGFQLYVAQSEKENDEKMKAGDHTEIRRYVSGTYTVYEGDSTWTFCTGFGFFPGHCSDHDRPYAVIYVNATGEKLPAPRSQIIDARHAYENSKDICVAITTVWDSEEDRYWTDVTDVSEC